MWTPFKEQKAPKILERLNDKVFSDTMDRYSVTKVQNIFWALQLASQVSSSEVVINPVTSGSVDTGLHRDGGKAIQIFNRAVGRTPAEGGRLLIDAAGEETYGKY
jgi:hypothetical protein